MIDPAKIWDWVMDDNFGPSRHRYYCGCYYTMWVEFEDTYSLVVLHCYTAPTMVRLKIMFSGKKFIITRPLNLGLRDNNKDAKWVVEPTEKDMVEFILKIGER